MAKEYFEKLSKLIEDMGLESEISSSIEVKHFFSGAALYIGGKICASLSPVGLAFKLPENEVEELISSGNALQLKYFPKGNIKKATSIIFLKVLFIPVKSLQDMLTLHFLMNLIAVLLSITS